MPELMIGALAASGFMLLIRFARTRGIPVSWWQWGLTLLGFLYTVFVLEVVVSFLREGSPKGAAVVGTLLGFAAVLWAVLLSRFVFTRRGSGRRADLGPKESGSHA